MCVERPPKCILKRALRQFVNDKYGQATTHWAKLEDRLKRGVGNPCPLVLFGLPQSMITFHEGEAALAEVRAADEADDQREIVG